MERLVNIKLDIAIKKYISSDHPIQDIKKAGSSTCIHRFKYANAKCLIAIGRTQTVLQVPRLNPLYEFVLDGNFFPSRIKEEDLENLADSCVNQEYEVEEFKEHIKEMIIYNNNRVLR